MSGGVVAEGGDIAGEGQVVVDGLGYVDDANAAAGALGDEAS